MYKKAFWIGVLVFSLAGLLAAAAPGATFSDAQARGWVMMRLDLDVTLDPGNEELTGEGTASLRLYDRQSSALMMALGESGEYLSFETAQGTPGSINDSGNFVVLYFDEPQPRGTEVDVRFRFCNRGRANQYVVSPKGAVASWVSGWYPYSSDGGEKAPGTTRLTVPGTWRTLSNGELTEVIERGDLRTEVWTTDSTVARSFAAGPYYVGKQEVGDREVAVYLLDDDTRRGETHLIALARCLEAQEARYGPLPYDGYAIAAVPDSLVTWNGSSEQGFSMIRSKFLRGGDTNLVLLGHEMAHSW